MGTQELIGSYVGELGLLLDTFPRQPLLDAADAVLTALQYDRTIYILGSPGRAAIASLVAANLVQRTIKSEIPPIRVLALTTTHVLMSGSLDEYNSGEMSSQSMSGLLRPGDVVIALSSRRHTHQIIDALEYAGAAGAITVWFAGQSGTEFMNLVDHSIIVPSASDDQLELMHLILAYTISSLVHHAAMERAAKLPASDRTDGQPHRDKARN